MVSDIWPRQDFQGQGHNNKVKGHVAHLNPFYNVPIKYQCPTPYSVRDIFQMKF